MKKTLCEMSLLLIFLFSVSGCQKTNNATPPPTPAPTAPTPPIIAIADYSTVISEKTWWGQLTNPGTQPQFYSVHFNADLSLVWSQASGDYIGNWKLDSNHLVLNFPSISVTVNADVAKDSTLTHITCSNSSTINSGKMLGLTSKPLIGTTWNGPYYDSNKLLHALTFIFSDAVNVDVLMDGVSEVYQYIVTTSGVVFRTNPRSSYFHVFFGLNNKDGVWVGTDVNPENTWTVFKQ
jgi:hypothetical protein